MPENQAPKRFAVRNAITTIAEFGNKLERLRSTFTMYWEKPEADKAVGLLDRIDGDLNEVIVMLYDRRDEGDGRRE